MFTLAAVWLLVMLAVVTGPLIVIWAISNELADDCYRALSKCRERNRHRRPSGNRTSKEVDRP